MNARYLKVGNPNLSSYFQMKILNHSEELLKGGAFVEVQVKIFFNMCVLFIRAKSHWKCSVKVNLGL